MKQTSKRIVESIIIGSLLLMMTCTVNGTAVNKTELESTNDTTDYSAYAGSQLLINDIMEESKSADLNTNKINAVGIPLEDATMNEDGEIIEAEFEPYTMYVNPAWLNVRSTPDSTVDSNILGKLNVNDEVTIIGEVGDGEWAVIEYNDQEAYISQEYIQETAPELDTYNNDWTGAKLDRYHGTCQGPSGKETYYNLNMSKCIYYMNLKGYYGYYWVRSDGVKMFTTSTGSYVMCAANLSVHPKGSLVETSLGTAIVCDTGGFAESSPYQIDICVTW